MQEAAETAKTERTRETQFLNACSAGLLSAVEELLEGGVAGGCTDTRQASGLHLAACRGHTAVLSFLLQHGQDVDAEDEAGRTGVFLPSGQPHLH